MAAEPGRKSPFVVVDGDSHVYEPEDIWDKYIPATESASAKHAFFHAIDERGERLTVLNGRPAKELNRSKIVRQAICRPDSTPEGIGSLDPSVFHTLNPAGSDPNARLADMDAMGVSQAVLFPTVFAEYFPLVEDPNAAATLARAYNDWIYDFCQADPVRLHPVAILPLQSPLLARRELHRIAEKGFTAAFLRPMFYAGGSQEIPNPMNRIISKMVDNVLVFDDGRRGPFIVNVNFDYLWRDIDELGLVACVHPSPGIASPEPASAGAFIDRVANKLDIGHSVAESVAYMQDNSLFLVAALFHGLLEDLPTLRIAIVHSGLSMVPLVLEKAETYLWLALPQIFGFSPPVSLEPAEVFSRHPIGVSFDGWEGSVARLQEKFPETLANKAFWGSRYPHHDASTPSEAVAMLESHGVAEDRIQRLMSGNASELFGLKVASVAS